MRWFRDTATFHQVTDGFFFGGAQSIYDAPTSSESGFTPKYLLEYKVLPDVLLYAGAAKGFREGGNTTHCPQARRRPGAAKIPPTSASPRPASPPSRPTTPGTTGPGSRRASRTRRS